MIANELRTLVQLCESFILVQNSWGKSQGFLEHNRQAIKYVAICCLLTLCDLSKSP